MKAVVMECCIRVCATPTRILAFRRHAQQCADAAFPGRTRRSSAIISSGSRLLLRQWHMHNDVGRLGEPQCQEVCLAFEDTSARLTPAKLEALSRDILATLDTNTVQAPAETVPWILTLTTAADATYRRQMADRHPNLHSTAKAADTCLTVSANQEIMQ